jgi:hypothetical protein
MSDRSGRATVVFDADERFCLIRFEPTLWEVAFGLGDQLFVVWDMALYKRVPFGNYGTWQAAINRVGRERDKIKKGRS